MNVSMSGLTIQNQDDSVVHMFRIVRRADIEKFCGHQKWEISDRFKEAEDPNDAVMLMKQWITGERLVQQPLLVVPVARFQKLGAAAPTKELDRNIIPVATGAQFKKTAERVARPPWNMVDASNYLTGLVERNRTNSFPAPPVLKFLHEKRAPCHVGAEGASDWQDFAPGTPKRVDVYDAADTAVGRRVRQRPAPAAAAVALAPGVVAVAPGASASSSGSSSSLASAPVALAAAKAAAMPKAAAVPKAAAAPKVKAKAAAPKVKAKVKAKAKVVAAPGPKAKAAPGPKAKAAPKAPPGRAFGGPRPQQNLGCSKCRQSAAGCKRCKHMQQLWQQANAAGAAAAAAAAPGLAVAAAP